MRFTTSFRICLFCLCSLVFAAPAYSQDKAITGKITGKDNELLTGAVAELRDAKDSSLAKVSVADVDGRYKLENVKPGTYFIKTSFLGYNPYFSKSFSFDGTSSKSMPEIKMEVSAVSLKGAEVSAFKPLVEVNPTKQFSMLRTV